MRTTTVKRALLFGASAAFLFVCACGHDSAPATENAAAAPATAPATPPTAPPAASTGGFDGSRAYQHVVQLTAIGPHSPGTDGIKRAQEYIIGQLKSDGCPVEEQDFHADTPIGNVAMKNIVAKIPSSNPNIILIGSHYDTKHLPDFVGADDSGSSTGVLLELASLLCARKNNVTVWLAFFDGEEAFNPQWADPDNTYGSREMAARLANSGDVSHVKAMILLDMVGPFDPIFRKEGYSTGWLNDMIWSTADRLGYKSVFTEDSGTQIEDDHQSFLRRGIPSADIIDFESSVLTYWHTPQDTIDKIDPRSLAATGYVVLEVVPELEKKFGGAAGK